MTRSVEITLPVLNEEATLVKQVRELHAFIENSLQDLGPITLVIADNGSTDGTYELAQLLTKELPGVAYLRLEQRGVGRALKASWLQSTADIVGYMDLDLATDLHSLRPALEKILSTQADVVTGSRLAESAQVIGRTALRNFTSKWFNRLVKIIFKVSFTDGMCGFKFMRRTILERLMAVGAQSDGWFFATELLITAEYLQYKVADLPVVWTDDPNSKVKIIKLAIEYLKAMRLLRKRLKRIKNKG